MNDLTKAQRELLSELSSGPRYAIWRTAAVKNLLAKGLIEAWGNDQMAGYKITDAGRALIAKAASDADGGER